MVVFLSPGIKLCGNRSKLVFRLYKFGLSPLEFLSGVFLFQGKLVNFSGEQIDLIRFLRCQVIVRVLNYLKLFAVNFGLALKFILLGP